MPLNAHGREAARAAGQFLRRFEIFPDSVFTTQTARTKETASLVLAELELKVEPQPKNAGFAKGRMGLDGKLNEWLGRLQPSVVMFVGHGVSQIYCISELPGSPNIPKEAHASVLVYDRTPNGWSLAMQHPGVV